MKKPLTLICREKTKFIHLFFLKILQRYWKLIVLSTVGMPGKKTPKMILSSCKKPLCLFAGKISTSSPMLYLRYCKDMQTSYFGYFEHAWLHTPKMIVSTCARLRCLYACKKQTSSFTSVLTYYILKNPAIWLADLQFDWKLEFSQIWDRWWNINNNISFHFRLVPKKTNDKIF